MLQNSDISLRALEPEDADLIYRWENDTGVWHLSHTLSPFSRYVIRQYLEHATKDIYEMKQQRFMVQLNESERPIGTIDLFDFDPFHRRAGVGILIAEKSDRKKGYAQQALESLKTYCFDILKLHQIYCNIAGYNTESIKLFTSRGFILTGTKKEWLFNGSGFDDELFYQCINPAHRTPGSHSGT